MSQLNVFGCGACLHFEACRKVKNVRKDTAYCLYRPSRFERAAQ